MQAKELGDGKILGGCERRAIIKLSQKAAARATGGGADWHVYEQYWGNICVGDNQATGECPQRKFGACAAYQDITESRSDCRNAIVLTRVERR